MLSSIPVPDGREYLPYQKKFIRYAISGQAVNQHTLLADEMGLGKTIQAIGLINGMGAMRVLVIAPAFLVQNWQNELDDWLVTLPGQHIQVISYHRAESYQEEGGIQWDLLIIDEAHYIKNPLSKRSGIITSVAKSAKHLLLLTGTPIENRPIELWPLLQLVAKAAFDPASNRVGVISPEQRKSHPGEGPNFWHFAKKYCGLKKSYYPRRGSKPGSAWDFSGATNLQELNVKLRQSCMVRRLKKDVLPELPNKRRQIIVLASKVDDSDLLPDLTEDNYSEQVAKLVADKITFETYAKRRHQQALDKLDACFQVISDMLDNTEKLIIFAHHQDVVEKLSHWLQSELPDGQTMVTVTGKTHVADRGSAVHTFQNNPLCKVFLGSIGAAGIGITLTAAHTVVFVELDPVPGKMTQAEDRAHRIGQTEMVHVVHLVANGSLCARIAKILVKKQDIINRVLDVS